MHQNLFTHFLSDINTNQIGIIRKKKLLGETIYPIVLSLTRLWLNQVIK